MKLKSNTRFLNIFDGKIYDKGDEFTVSTESDKDYLIKNKIASEIKEVKKSDKSDKKEEKK